MQSSATDGDAERIRTLDDAWAAAAARQDLEGMMAIYASDAQEMLPGCPAIAGREAIRRFYAGLIQQFPRFAHHFEPEAITVAQSGDADTLKPEQVQVGKFVGVQYLEQRPSAAVTFPP